VSEIVLVAAMGRNRVIGIDGAMPWHLPADLRRFKELTMGAPMIMGRATFDSIGKVLPGRSTIVLTRRRSLQLEGAIVVHTPEDAIGVARGIAGADHDVMVVGGGQIYRLFLSIADRIELTTVDAAPGGDTTFPALDPGTWRVVAAETVAGEPSMTFETLVRAR